MTLWIQQHQALILLAAKLAAGLLAVGVALKVLAALLAVLQSKLIVFAAMAAGILLLLDALKITNTGFLAFVESIRIGYFKIGTWTAALVTGIQAMWADLINWLRRAWEDFAHWWMGMVRDMLKGLFSWAGRGDLVREIEDMQRGADKGHEARRKRINQQWVEDLKRLRKQMDAVFEADKGPGKNKLDQLKKQADDLLDQIKKNAGGLKMPGGGGASKIESAVIGTFSGRAAPWKVSNLNANAPKLAKEQVEALKRLEKLGEKGAAELKRLRELWQQNAIPAVFG